MKETIIIIGAGAAGLTASIFAAKSNSRIILLERTSMTGKKILISGGTRCNVLPVAVSAADYFTVSSKNTMKNILKTWKLEECHKWFSKEVGLKMITEKGSEKWFPASNSAMEVRDLLLKRAISSGVEIVYNAGIGSIKKIKNIWSCRTFDGKEYRAEKIIIATGGLSFPQMGTDGAGHNFLKNAGHTINPTFPALTPLKGKHPGKQELAGISLDVELSVKLDSKKKIKAKRTGFLFTHRGYSGPSILDLSHYAIQALEKYSSAGAFNETPLYVNWNGFSEEKWSEILSHNIKGNVLNLIKEYLPNRLAEALCIEAGLTERRLAELKKSERINLIELLVRYKLPYNGHEGYAKAEVTGGGIPLEEINTSTLESKIISGLFMCGEVLDTFGRIGGFNFYWAWVTGRLAGLSAGKTDS